MNLLSLMLIQFLILVVILLVNSKSQFINAIYAICLVIIAVNFYIHINFQIQKHLLEMELINQKHATKMEKIKCDANILNRIN
jgi:hypothetical protein